MFKLRLFAGLLCCLLSSVAFAEAPLTVGVSSIPPLVISESGSMRGFDIELWEAIASELSLKYEYKLLPFADLLSSLEAGKLDAAIAGITITAEREGKVDFTHHYLDSGLAAVVSNTSQPGLLTAISSLFKRSTLLLLLSFLGFTVVCGHILWLSERGAEAIDDSYIPGIFEAFWCTIATATTVGYGDVVPRKFVGRIAALVVMLAGIGFFGILSADLMASLTTIKLSSDIESSKDLKGKPVATMRGTTSVPVLQKLQSIVHQVDTIDEAYRLLQEGFVVAVVFDAPVLQHFVQNAGAGEVFLAGGVFNRQYYGIAVQSSSPLREKINRALLTLQINGTYDRIYRKWFGEFLE